MTISRHVRSAGALVLLWSMVHTQERPLPADALEYSFDKHYGQVEVGGPFVGVEFHNSWPIPSRISFYYPVANSIDLSTDYWKRSASLPLALGLRAGDGQRKWIGKEPWNYTLSPHKVVFETVQDQLSIQIIYEFCLNLPAMVLSVKMKNTASKDLPVELYSHLVLALRTCQTYARKDSAYTTYDSASSSIVARFDDSDTRNAAVFVQNVGAYPEEWTSSAADLQASDDGSSHWVSSSSALGKSQHSSAKERSVAAFVYRKTLGPGQSMVVSQMIGSCNQSEVGEKTKLLAKTWSQEVESYDRFVRVTAQGQNKFITGDPWLDRSDQWARAILATNAHFLEDRIVPMPCPAEYNFFFTHDLLMTNLGAVNYDLPRVKRDLLYVASRAKDNIIPHAYYWRDDGYKTEYCTPSNWNHLWFVILTASYLRHSLDESAAKQLLPLVTKSIEEVLTQKKADNLMYAFRPDWWDIGWNEGPRTYITALTIRALRDYAFTCSFLREFSPKLLSYEQLADSMQHALESRLWDKKQQYLTNENSGIPDPHYYMGSLVAPVFHALDQAKSGKLVETARRELVAPGVGVRTAMPADFHTDSSKAFYKFVDDEAGQPYVYANGGVWPHNNAWYILALQSVGKADEALQFLRTTMTVDGIAHSPMGQPAMYEYRISNPTSPDYGSIDKPSFLWAGGFYLYSLYHLLGFGDQEWNVVLSTTRPETVDNTVFTYAFGSTKTVTVRGHSSMMHQARVDGNVLASFVLPLEAARATTAEYELGTVDAPYLDGINAIVHRVTSNKGSLVITVSSFEGHETVARFISRNRPGKVTVDGKKLKAQVQKSANGSLIISVTFRGSNKEQVLTLNF
ncbi:MAG: amylo-alpha-1,6-glucosidase [Bacteroidota bacterium]